MPFLLVKRVTDEWLGVANAMACGVMLAASFEMINEGETKGPGWVVVGMGLGVVFVKFTQDWLEEHGDVNFASLSGANAKKTVLAVGIMTIHSIGEGVGMGVAFAGDNGWKSGTTICTAMGIHNIPEGVAVAALMISNGSPFNAAFFWALMHSMPQPVLAFFGYSFVDKFTGVLPLAMGFPAGCMLWLVFAELIPEAQEHLSASTVGTVATCSAAILQLLAPVVDAIAEGKSPTVILHHRTADLLHDSPVAILPLVLLLLACSSSAFVAPGPRLLGLAAGSAFGMGFCSFVVQFFTCDHHTGISLLGAGTGLACAYALEKATAHWALAGKHGKLPSYSNGHGQTLPILGNGRGALHKLPGPNLGYTGRLAVVAIGTMAMYNAVEGLVAARTPSAGATGTSFMSAIEVGNLLPVWLFSLTLLKVVTRSTAQSLALSGLLCALQPAMTYALRSGTPSYSSALLFARNMASAMLAVVSFEKVFYLAKAYDRARAYTGAAYGAVAVIAYQQLAHSVGYQLMCCMS